MTNLEVNEFMKAYKSEENSVLLDVRTPEEESEGLIPNSLRIDIMSPAFPAKILELDKSKHYYVYCRSGARSASACQFMEKNGFSATNLEGGINSYNQNYQK